MGWRYGSSKRDGRAPGTSDMVVLGERAEIILFSLILWYLSSIWVWCRLPDPPSCALVVVGEINGKHKGWIGAGWLQSLLLLTSVQLSSPWGFTGLWQGRTLIGENNWISLIRLYITTMYQSSWKPRRWWWEGKNILAIHEISWANVII